MSFRTGSKPGTSGTDNNERKHGLFGEALKSVADIVTIPVCPGHWRLTDGYNNKIDRGSIFKQAISFYKSSRSDKHIQLMVTFLTDGVEKEALDGGGVRREFYSSFFKECLKEANMFVGEPRRKMPSNDMTMVQNGYFEALGRAIVASILNGDCGFPYMAPVVYYYLVDEDPIPYLSLQDVPDPGIKHLAEKMKNKEALVQQLVRWSILDKRKMSLDKLKQGLNHMGFLKATKKNPMLLPLLVYSSQYKVTADYVRNKIMSGIEQLQGKRESQRKSKQFMIEYLKDISDEDAQALFQFITGAADPPVEEEYIEVDFNSFNSTQKLPEANTCSSKFWIPVGNSNATEFKKSLKGALEHARHGFGNA